MNLFEDITKKIKTEYTTGGNKLGWRFLLNSKNTLQENNGIIFVTLNPGGSKIITEHGVESCENGCAYLVESWKGNKPGESILQKQFQALFKEIAKRLSIEDYKEVLNSSLCSYFIPFRSKSYRVLINKKRAVNFSISIWSEILSSINFKIIICIDKVTFKSIKKILVNFNYTKTMSAKFNIGWGDYSADINKYKVDNKIVSIIRFPHLSRFAIFNRAESRAHIKVIFDEVFKTYE